MLVYVSQQSLLRWAGVHTSLPTPSKQTATTEEMRGFKLDQAMDLPNMLSNQREVDGELEGFKSRFYHVDPNDPEQSARVLSYFKSRQPPPPEKRLSFREALKKPREVFKKTREQVSSFMKSRPSRGRIEEKDDGKKAKIQPMRKDQK